MRRPKVDRKPLAPEAVPRFGVPDWREPNAYPKELTPDGWAWEFLRRNDDYRRYFLQHHDTPSIPSNFARALDSPTAQTKRAGADSSGTKERVIQNWGFLLMRPVDPSLSAVEYPSVRFWPTEWRTLAAKWKPSRMRAVKVEWDLSMREVAIKFDAALPLQGQLAAARKLLQERQRNLAVLESVRKKARKVSRKNLVTSLRILDAIAVGASYAEIAFKLGLSQNAANTEIEHGREYKSERIRELVKKRIQAAKALVRDYRSVVSLRASRRASMGKKRSESSFP